MTRDLLNPLDPAPGGSFALAKLYADCVAPSGEGAIVYAGEVTWKAIKLSLSCMTFFDRDGAASESWALSSGEASLAGRELRWGHHDSTLLAQASCDGVSELLFESAEGSIAFDCIVPDGSVRLTRGTRRLEGRGYAERLEMTIPPWSLPIDSLRWGRLTSPEERIVWIEWSGVRPLTRVLRNGALCGGAIIRKDRVELPGSGALLLGDPRVLRAGRLGGMRGAVSWLVAQLPGIAGIHETKLLRTGRVELADRIIAEGWVIDEEVQLR